MPTSSLTDAYALRSPSDFLDTFIDGDRAFRTHESPRFRVDAMLAWRLDGTSGPEQVELPTPKVTGILLYLYDKNSGRTIQDVLTDEYATTMLEALDSQSDRLIVECLSGRDSFSRVSDTHYTLDWRLQDKYLVQHQIFDAADDNTVNKLLDLLGQTELGDFEDNIWIKELRAPLIQTHSAHVSIYNANHSRISSHECSVREKEAVLQAIPVLSSEDEQGTGYLRRHQSASRWLETTLSRCLRDGVLHQLPEEEKAAGQEMIEPYIASAVKISHVNGAMFKELSGLTPEAFRNRMQVFDLVQRSIPAWSELMKLEEVVRAIDHGEPLKVSLSEALPLANTSKSSMNKFFLNLAAMTAARSDSFFIGQDHLSPSLPRPIHTEKSVIQVHYYQFRVRDPLNMAAIVATLPEKALFGETGESLEAMPDGKKIQAFGLMQGKTFLDGAMASIYRSCELHRNGGEPLSKTLTWMNRITSNEALGNAQMDVNDGYRILNDSFSRGLTVYALNQSEGLRDAAPARRNPHRVSTFDLSRQAANMVSYGKVLDVAKKAHQAFQRIAKLGGAKGKVTWDPAIEAPFKHHNLHIVPLHSSQALHDEGKELDHCVGTYVEKAMTGKSFIFSVREGDRPLSTLEIDATENPCEVVQHYGLHNSDPTPEAADIVSRFMTAIRQGNITLKTETGISQKDLDEMPLIELWEMKIGLAISDPVVISAIQQEFEQMLPGIDPWGKEKNEVFWGDEYSQTVDRLRTSIRMPSVTCLSSSEGR